MISNFKKIKIVLGIILLAIIILSVILLWVNNWSYNFFVALTIIAILLEILFLLCLNKPNLSMAIVGMIVSGLFSLLIIGNILNAISTSVCYVYSSQSKSIRLFIPVGQELEGNRHIRLQVREKYVYNCTGRTLYFTTIKYEKKSYGGKNQSYNNVSSLKSGNVKNLRGYETLYWFVNPREKIKVARGIDRQKITYVDFCPY